jgi:hypothetical protein
MRNWQPQSAFEQVRMVPVSLAGMHPPTRMKNYDTVSDRRYRPNVKRLLAIGALIAGASAVGAGVASLSTDEQSSEASAVVVQHVHGLGLNPADDAVLVATHNGLFRIDGEGPSRVGESFQDTMGFTVLGPDHFLGSGHPDLAGVRAGQPGRLGLIESTDGGETWDVMSLSDAADLHAIEIADGGVYAWDAGSAEVLFSADRRSWEKRSTTELLSLAADPADPAHLVAGVGEATIESTDGGRAWAASADAPGLTHVDWDDDLGLWGLDVTGGVWRATENGWLNMDSLAGSPQAIAVGNESIIAAVVEPSGSTAIYRSEDGTQWETIYRGD